MLNIGSGRRDLLIALARRVAPAFGLALIALGLQAGGGRPYIEVLP